MFVCVKKEGMKKATTNAAEQTDLVADAREVLLSEAKALKDVAGRLDENFSRAVELILSRTGPESPGALVVTGVGKSGLTGTRLSASFASTGTPSHFLHPVEAVHGDLGRVRRGDVVLLLSYGGESDELLRLADALKRMDVPIIAITGKKNSSLAKLADICIDMGAIEEACPLKLAPTTTVTCMSAVGNALVIGVMSSRNFSVEEYAIYHPAGSLGRKLLKVSQAMEFRVGVNFTPLPDSLSVREVLARDKTAGRRAGAIVLINGEGKLSGVFTDGDLRRKVESTIDFLDRPIVEMMTKNPKHIAAEALASEAMAIMNKHRIDELPVVDEAGKPVGLIDVQDLVRLRIAE
jgi:arabinose-5-phosphate isomerase